MQSYMPGCQQPAFGMDGERSSVKKAGMLTPPLSAVIRFPERDQRLQAGRSLVEP